MRGPWQSYWSCVVVRRRLPYCRMIWGNGVVPGQVARTAGSCCALAAHLAHSIEGRFAVRIRIPVPPPPCAEVACSP